VSSKSKIFTLPIWLAFVAILIPLLVTILKKDNKPDLTGIVISEEKPELSRQSWFDGTYQEEREDYNSDHWAFKESMVRWNNQLYYKLFNQLRVNGFVAGKGDYVFSENYIFSAFGDDLIPESEISELLRKAKVVQDTLKKKNIDLLLVYAPGKGSYCKEYIQDKYQHPIKTTNHAVFVSNSKKFNVNHLDLLTYFEKLKPTTPYPLFPKFGHHWSYYGACIATDTLIKHIEKLHEKSIPRLIWSKIEVVDTARSRDADVLKSMNLRFNPPQGLKLAYPQIEWEQDSTKNKVRVLTISDSYFYDQVYMQILQNSFGNGQFWYYYNKVIPSPKPGEKVEAWELDLKTEIESNQVIMLLYSDGNLPKFGNNFIQDAYELYTSPKTYSARVLVNKQIQEYAKQIRNTPLLLKKSTNYSKINQLTLDSAIKRDAMIMAGFIKN
jgi:hypothetical protein